MKEEREGEGSENNLALFYSIQGESENDAIGAQSGGKESLPLITRGKGSHLDYFVTSDHHSQHNTLKKQSNVSSETDHAVPREDNLNDREQLV